MTAPLVPTREAPGSPGSSSSHGVSTQAHAVIHISCSCALQCAVDLGLVYWTCSCHNPWVVSALAGLAPGMYMRPGAHWQAPGTRARLGGSSRPAAARGALHSLCDGLAVETRGAADARTTRGRRTASRSRHLPLEIILKGRAVSRRRRSDDAARCQCTCTTCSTYSGLLSLPRTGSARSQSFPGALYIQMK